MGADCPRLRRLFSMSDGALPSQAMKFGAKETVTFWILRRVAGISKLLLWVESLTGLNGRFTFYAVNLQTNQSERRLF